MNVMMLAGAQSGTGQVRTSEVGNTKSNALFGSILSNSITQSKEPVDTSLNLSDEQSQKIAKLLEFFNLDDISDLEEGQKLADEMLVSTESLQDHPLLKQILTELSDKLNGNKDLTSIEDMVASLLAIYQVPNEVIENPDFLQKLDVLIQKMSQDPNLAKFQFNNSDSILLLGKIHLLMKNQLDLTDEQLQKLDSLKQSIEKIVNKLNSLLSTSSKEKISMEQILSRQLGAQQQSSQNARTNSYASSTNTNGDHQNVKGMSTLGESSVSSNPFMNMSKLEQFVLTLQGSTSKGGVNQEQLIKSFESILSKAQLTNANGVQKLFVKLNPEHLGSLRIELIQRDGVMFAKIVASNSKAKELLETQMQGLRQAFANQNLTVDKLEISQQFQNMPQERQLQRESGQQSNQQQQQEAKLEEDEAKDFLDQFEQAIIEAEV
ncbi:MULTISPECIES: flagellar hook-length control protein FliK [Bacillus]|uniref:flagellar hook-length control protein FliK n=1 Tax=Bacillus TaxID=1386 RepID=UPI0002E6CE7E|nr:MULTISPECIES: flagellar hook-length control protein FliK [Bacillus]